MDIVKGLNFKIVTTTKRGNICLEHKKYMSYCLPRIMLTENFNLKYIGRISKKGLMTI
jgi:hypothetical protein